MAGRVQYSPEEILALFSGDYNTPFEPDSLEFYVAEAIQPFGMFPTPNAADSFLNGWPAAPKKVERHPKRPPQASQTKEKPPPPVKKEPATWGDVSKTLSNSKPAPKKTPLNSVSPVVFCDCDVTGWAQKPKKAAPSFDKILSEADDPSLDIKEPEPEPIEAPHPAPKPGIVKILPEQFAVSARRDFHNPPGFTPPDPSKFVPPDPSRFVPPDPSRFAPPDPSRFVPPDPSRFVPPDPKSFVMSRDSKGSGTAPEKRPTTHRMVITVGPKE